jgi:hypothetical protein
MTLMSAEAATDGYGLQRELYSVRRPWWLAERLSAMLIRE